MKNKAQQIFEKIASNQLIKRVKKITKLRTKFVSSYKRINTY